MDIRSAVNFTPALIGNIDDFLREVGKQEKVGRQRFSDPSTFAVLSVAVSVLGVKTTVVSGTYGDQIDDLGDPRVTVVRPIPFRIETTPTQIVAVADDVEQFAIADSYHAAVAELKALLVELYFLLRDEQLELGPLPSRQLEILRRHIRET